MTSYLCWIAKDSQSACGCVDLTGPCQLNGQPKTIWLPSTDICLSCGEEEEKAEHYVYSCPASMGVRERLLDFILKTGRIDLHSLSSYHCTYPCCPGIVIRSTSMVKWTEIYLIECSELFWIEYTDGIFESLMILSISYN